MSDTPEQRWAEAAQDALRECIAEVRQISAVLKAKPEQSCLDAAEEVMLALSIADARAEAAEAECARLRAEIVSWQDDAQYGDRG
jgi:hypothetical protein